MRILIHDFAGHVYATELSRALARDGHEVTHAYCGGVTTGRGAVELLPGDPAGLQFVDVSAAPFERYSPLRRVRSEWDYGRRVVELLKGVRPDVVLSANCPLIAQALIWRTCRRLCARRVYWLQDFLGYGTRAVLAAKSPLLGSTAGAAMERLETSLLRGADAIVAISEDFESALRTRRVSTPVTVIENWTPLAEVPVRPKDTEWSRRHGLADVPVALYSGTLGLKHDPEHLVEAALALDGTDAVVLVVTEGLGRDFLERRRAQLGLTHLQLLDFVAWSDVPDLLGAADVCLALLDPGAGTFSVPSKILTYLAAGRAVVGALPPDNLAARTLTCSGAGRLVPPGDHNAFAKAVAELLGDATLCASMGERGRAHALTTFDIERITPRFERVLGIT